MTDLQKTRLKIISAPAALLLAVFIIWLVAGKSPEPTGSTPVPGAVTAPVADSRGWWQTIGNILKSPSEQPGSPAKNVGTPEKTIPEAFSSFAEDIKKTAEAVNLRALTKEIASSTPAPGSKYKATQQEITLNITNEEFHFLYPQKFLDALQKDAQAFIGQIDSSYKPFAALERDADVRLVQEKLVTALVAKGWYNEADKNTFLYNMRFVLPELQLANLEFRKGAESENKLPLVEKWLRQGTRIALHAADFVTILIAGDNKYDTPLTATDGLFSRDSVAMLQKVKENLLPKANAQFSNNNRAITAFCDSDGQCCYYGAPECWAEGPAFDGKPGAVTVTPYCDCDSYYSYLGCVSFCRTAYGAASIWDGPIGSVGGKFTNICGCGLGGGGGGDGGGGVF